MVGTHALAACSDVAANTTAVPCTVSVHTPTVLSGYVVSVTSFQLTLELAALGYAGCQVVRKSY